MSEQQHVLPFYDIESIPSGFMGYPKGTKISVRPFSFGEQLNLQKVGTQGRDLFKSILDGVKCSIPKTDLTPQDVMYLGVYRKLISTKHDKITVETTCPSCAAVNKTPFTLKQLVFKTPQFTKVPIEVELSNHIVHFGLLSVKKFTDCVNNHNGEPLAMLAAQATLIMEKDDDIEREKWKIHANDGSDKFYNLARKVIGSSIDFDKEILDEASAILEDYGLKPLDIICEDEFCKHEYEVTLEDKGVLVYPFRDNKESARSRITFC
jgi:hypothetical protein